MKLATFKNESFDRGASRLKEALWIIVSELLVASFVPGSAWRRALLRLFGAKIAAGVVLKPRVRIKFPWRLSVGKHSWIGEGVWIDNLAHVSIGENVCISQGAYLCTGNHDWKKDSFDLIVQEIKVENACWIGAGAKIAPGARLSEGAVVGLGTVVRGHLGGWKIYTAGEDLVSYRDRPRTPVE